MLADGATLDTEQHRDAARARPDLRQPRRPQRRARPQRRQREGALTDLLEVTAENFGGQGEQFNQTIQDFGDLSQTLDTTRTSCSARPRALQGFIRRWPRTTQTVRQFNQSLADVSDHARRASARSWPRRCSNLGVALDEVVDLRPREPRLLGRNIRGLNRVAEGAGQAARRPRRDPHGRARWRSTTWPTYNPQAGTLDTRANIGELVDQLEHDPRRPVRHRQQADDPGQRLRRDRGRLPGLPRAGAVRPGPGRRPATSATTRPSADWWRWRR